MNRLLLIVLISGFIGWISACTTVSTANGSYSTIGQAHIQECDQVVFPEGIGDKKEAIGFNCRDYQSHGLSSEFGAIIKTLFGWIPWPW